MGLASPLDGGSGTEWEKLSGLEKGGGSGGGAASEPLPATDDAIHASVLAATWAAMTYPEISALVLDASFDDLVPLALKVMPESWSK